MWKYYWRELARAWAEVSTAARSIDAPPPAALPSPVRSSDAVQRARSAQLRRGMF